MKKLVNIILPLIILTIISSCEQETNVVFPPYEPKIVVNGLISDQEPSLVVLSQSTASQDTGFIPFITRASVQVLSSNGSLYDNLTYDAFQGGFVGSKAALQNAEYQIRVNYEDQEVRGTTRLTPGVPINTFKYQDSVGLDSSGFPLGELTLEFTDVVGQDNYYRINMYYYDDIRQSFQVFDLNEDAFLNARAEETEKGFVFDDLSFNGRSQTISVPVPFGFTSPTAPYKFLVRLESLNNDLAQYEKSRELYFNSIGGLFSEPIDLYSNIRGGLGIFGGSSLSTDTLR